MEKFRFQVITPLFTAGPDPRNLDHEREYSSSPSQADSGSGLNNDGRYK